MPVITLTPSLLSGAILQLSRRIQASGCNPAVIVGIQSGGAEVARQMLQDFPETIYCEVSLSRPGTKQKGSGLTHRLLQKLPLWLCDGLRVVESRINEFRSKRQPQIRLGKIVLPQEAIARLKETSRPLLIVDDAIDTGATIQQARLQLKQQYPDLQVQVAVITVTTPHPECDADFCLYHNRTLCRFPWSNDYRN